MEPKLITTEEYKELEKDFGKLQFWDSKPFIDAANILVAGDEPMNALKLLTDLVPGYYRDNPPPELTVLSRKIHKLLATPTFYQTNIYDARVREDKADESVNYTYRGKTILLDVQNFNTKGQTPHLIDFGPGEYWLPIGLKKLGCSFTYQDIGLHDGARQKAKEHLVNQMREPFPDAPRIYVACEIIEHLHNPNDVLVEFMKSGGLADIIHVSTPKYSFDCSKERLDWEKLGDLGHLRTFTPNEFLDVILKMFPDYEFQFMNGQIMHVRGTKKGIQ